MKKAIKVLLADDHVMVREALRTLLKQEADIVVAGEAGNGREAITLTKSLLPDVIVMDIAMPCLNGLEAVRQIHRIHPAVKLLILSAYDDDAYVDQAIALGATGYLMKQTASRVLPEAIRKVHEGVTFFSSAIAKRQSQQRHRAFEAGKPGSPKSVVRLSPRETEVLQLIAEGHMNKSMADELGISIKTVENHRQSLMKKLDIHDIAGLTRYAISAGIIESRVRTLVV